jgi:hypothetical protein
MLGRVFGKLLYWAGKRWLIRSQASDFTGISDVQPLALSNGVFPATTPWLSMNRPTRAAQDSRNSWSWVVNVPAK